MYTKESERTWSATFIAVLIVVTSSIAAFFVSVSLGVLVGIAFFIIFSLIGLSILLIQYNRLTKDRPSNASKGS